MQVWSPISCIFLRTELNLYSCDGLLHWLYSPFMVVGDCVFLVHLSITGLQKIALERTETFFLAVYILKRQVKQVFSFSIYLNLLWATTFPVRSFQAPLISCKFMCKLVLESAIWKCNSRAVRTVINPLEQAYTRVLILLALFQNIQRKHKWQDKGTCTGQHLYQVHR